MRIVRVRSPFSADRHSGVERTKPIQDAEVVETTITDVPGQTVRGSGNNARKRSRRFGKWFYVRKGMTHQVSQICSSVSSAAFMATSEHVSVEQHLMETKTTGSERGWINFTSSAFAGVSREGQRRLDTLGNAFVQQHLEVKKGEKEVGCIRRSSVTSSRFAGDLLQGQERLATLENEFIEEQLEDRMTTGKESGCVGFASAVSSRYGGDGRKGHSRHCGFSQISHHRTRGNSALKAVTAHSNDRSWKRNPGARFLGESASVRESLKLSAKRNGNQEYQVERKNFGLDESLESPKEMKATWSRVCKQKTDLTETPDSHPSTGEVQCVDEGSLPLEMDKVEVNNDVKILFRSDPNRKRSPCHRDCSTKRVNDGLDFTRISILQKMGDCDEYYSSGHRIYGGRGENLGPLQEGLPRSSAQKSTEGMLGEPSVQNRQLHSLPLPYNLGTAKNSEISKLRDTSRLHIPAEELESRDTDSNEEATLLGSEKVQIDGNEIGVDRKVDVHDYDMENLLNESDYELLSFLLQPASPEPGEIIDDSPPSSNEAVRSGELTNTDSNGCGLHPISESTVRGRPTLGLEREYNYASNHHSRRDVEEKALAVDTHRLTQRQKQINYGKNTPGYCRYIECVPRHKRRTYDPSTPDKLQSCSKRSWDGQIRKWRRLLHAFDPPHGYDLKE